ncbi:restriction endonuclease subunit S [Enterococcus faecalis]|uniref:restriction endonuclease subunit S n=1 Tax=Enterococcus faecalis TaxID=1351 RepID=UPI00115E85BB|nr:restriction endonuclease subunit S [Enterococcus faecalis]EHU9670275.1 restriction endonuclease subunit S [Enterococcus faecalis]EHV0134483.1 restriction endonuclease subunit S [Enterococcus faecalis]
MRDEMKKVPRLRFRGFQEDWELCKFEKLTDFFSGLTYSPDNVQKDGTFVLRSSNVKDNAIVSADNVYVRNEVANSEHVQVGDVIVVVRNGSRSLIGKHAPINREMPNTVIGAFMTGLRSPSPKFLKALLDTQQFNVEIHKNLGATINQITTGEFKRMHFTVPTDEDEKEKIGSLFRQLDDIIALHQRKLDQLKELKKAYLQVMFPAKDERVPKLRFADFEGEWEQCKLEDLANKYNNLRIPITASKRIYGNTPYYGANGIQDFVEGYTHDGEFILVAEDGASNLKDYPVQYVNGKVWVNNHAHVLQAKRSKADNKFLMNAIKSINIEPFLVGGGRSKLNSEVMMNLEINTPSKDEQLKISTLCKQLDDITALYQNKLNQLKNLKKSYLQNMFI